MYDHTLHRRRKHFCRYCLQAFSSEEISKSHIKDRFKINGKQRTIMPRKGEFVKFRNSAQNKSMSKTQLCSYGCNLVCVNDSFIYSMTEESKYCNEVMKKHFNKELVMTKEDKVRC